MKWKANELPQNIDIYSGCKISYSISSLYTLSVQIPGEHLINRSCSCPQFNFTKEVRGHGDSISLTDVTPYRSTWSKYWPYGVHVTGQAGCAFPRGVATATLSRQILLLYHFSWLRASTGSFRTIVHSRLSMQPRQRECCRGVPEEVVESRKKRKAHTYTREGEGAAGETLDVLYSNA